MFAVGRHFVFALCFRDLLFCASKLQQLSDMVGQTLTVQQLSDMVGQTLTVQQLSDMVGQTLKVQQRSVTWLDRR